MVGFSGSKTRAQLILLFVFFIALTFGIFIGSAIGYVSAQIPAPNLLYACINNRGEGGLRIIPSNRKCGRNETLVKLTTGEIKQSNNGEPLTCGGCKFNESGNLGSRFKGKDLSNSFLAYSKFGAGNGSADLSGTIFKNADLTGVYFYQANLQNADFSNANLSEATGLEPEQLKGAIWSNTTCPDGTNSNSNKDTCEGHLMQ